MKLSQLAAKPQLIRIELDTPEIKEIYKDSLEFWVYDRQDMDVFVKLATLDVTNFEKLTSLVNAMILDETGQPIVREGLALPSDVLMAAIQKVIEMLGKPQQSTLPDPVQS
jgi:hypothetical protein